MASKAGGEVLYAVEWNSVDLAFKDNSVIRNMGLSVSGDLVTYVASGIGVAGGEYVNSSGAYITHTSASPTGTRVDLVSLSGNGAFVATEGSYASGAAVANPPTIPTNQTPLALVTIGSTVTSLTAGNLKDVRMFNYWTDVNESDILHWTGSSTRIIRDQLADRAYVDTGSSSTSYSINRTWSNPVNYRLHGGSKYDDFEDNTINTTLWLTGTTASYGASSVIETGSGTNTDGYLLMANIDGNSGSNFVRLQKNLSGANWNIHFYASGTIFGAGSDSIGWASMQMQVVSGTNVVVIGSSHADAGGTFATRWDCCINGSTIDVYSGGALKQATIDLSTVGADWRFQWVLRGQGASGFRSTGSLMIHNFMVTSGGEVATHYISTQNQTQLAKAATVYFSGTQPGSTKIIPYISNDSGTTWHNVGRSGFPVFFRSTGSGIKAKLELTAAGSSIPEVKEYGLMWDYF